MKLSNLIFCVLIALFLILGVLNIYVIVKTNQTKKELENVKYELIRIHNEMIVNQEQTFKNQKSLLFKGGE